MLQLIDVGIMRIDRYAGLCATDMLDEVRELAEPLRGTRVLHLNATPYGGGVSEILRSMIPLLRDVGIDADWRIISGSQEFFRITKKVHDGLQGMPGELTEAELEHYTSTAQTNAKELSDDYDLVVVHDPQPAPIASIAQHRSARWVWRCHIDTSAPSPYYQQLLARYRSAYDAVVYTMPEFVPPDTAPEEVFLIPPAIDPLSPKNVELPEQLARDVLNWIGVDAGYPLVTQVSRFDPWKDPIGVINVYREVRREYPRLQLALVGSMSSDDPGAWEMYRRVIAEARGDELIHVYTNVTGVGNIEVNAFQRMSSVAMQQSIREGFGLVVSETMWKRTPVVARRAGGIGIQMPPGVGGLLVDSHDDAVRAVCELLADPLRARELGNLGRAHVCEHFTIPRLIRDELLMMHSLGIVPRRPRPTRAELGKRIQRGTLTVPATAAAR
jgi:trehalose synthase